MHIKLQRPYMWLVQKFNARYFLVDIVNKNAFISEFRRADVESGLVRAVVRSFKNSNIF